MLSKVQKTVIYFKIKTSTHTDEVTIESHKRWNHLGKLITNRTIKKKVRIWLMPELALIK
mgnify:FL=1|jgi:hypothetical protein